MSMWRGGQPQERVESYSLVLGYVTAGRPVKGPRHVMAEGKRGGRAVVAGLVGSEAHARRRESTAKASVFEVEVNGVGGCFHQ